MGRTHQFPRRGAQENQQQSNVDDQATVVDNIVEAAMAAPASQPKRFHLVSMRVWLVAARVRLEETRAVTKVEISTCPC
jgi:hypothetical protein